MWGVDGPEVAPVPGVWHPCTTFIKQVSVLLLRGTWLADLPVVWVSLQLTTDHRGSSLRKVWLKWKRVVSVLLWFYSTMAHTGPPFFSQLHTATAFTSVVSCFPAVPAPVLAAEVDAEAQQILFQTTTSNKSTPSSAARHFHLYNPPLKHSGSGLRLRFHFLVVTVMAR